MALSKSRLGRKSRANLKKKKRELVMTRAKGKGRHVSIFELARRRVKLRRGQRKTIKGRAAMYQNIRRLNIGRKRKLETPKQRARRS